MFDGSDTSIYATLNVVESASETNKEDCKQGCIFIIYKRNNDEGSEIPNQNEF